MKGLSVTACLLLVAAVTVTDASHSCTTCPKNACAQNETHIGFCNDGSYSLEPYQCNYTRSEMMYRGQYRCCGWFCWGRCGYTETYYVTVTGYQTCYRNRRVCQRRCCHGFQFINGNCEPPCGGNCRGNEVCIDNACVCHNQTSGPICANYNCTGGCLNGGTCLAQDTCNCTSGWNGTNCAIDIDECALNISGCDHECTNTPGAYYCSCQKGYRLSSNSHKCIDVDECSSTDNGGCDQNCTNTPGSYNCSCMEGFEMNEENNTCVVPTEFNFKVNAQLDSSGVAAISVIAVLAVIITLVLCVVVAIAIVMKLRAPVCQRGTADKTSGCKTIPEDDFGFQLERNPSYSMTQFTKTSQNGKAQPAKHKGGGVAKGNVYTSTEQELAYANVLY